MKLTLTGYKIKTHAQFEKKRKKSEIPILGPKLHKKSKISVLGVREITPSEIVPTRCALQP